MTKFIPVLAAIAATAFASSAMAQSVPNGSFENPNVGSGYSYATNPNTADTTFNGTAGIAGNGSAFGYNTPFGSQVGFIQANLNDYGSINQIVTGLNAGQDYTVTFYSSARPGYETVLPINVSFNNTYLGTVTPTSTTFTSSSFNFMSDVTNGTLRFYGETGIGNDINSAIDNISVAAAGTTGAVPEPATWAMMLLGFGMIGFGLRYRRKSATARLA